jgi:hypothetical protein
MYIADHSKMLDFYRIKATGNNSLPVQPIQGLAYVIDSAPAVDMTVPVNQLGVKLSWTRLQSLETYFLKGDSSIGTLSSRDCTFEKQKQNTRP